MGSTKCPRMLVLLSELHQLSSSPTVQKDSKEGPLRILDVWLVLEHKATHAIFLIPSGSCIIILCLWLLLRRHMGSSM